MKNSPTHRTLIVIASICCTITAIPGASGAERDAPSMEFLEYLGEWETTDGEWIDPATLAENEVIDPVETKTVYTIEEQSDE